MTLVGVDLHSREQSVAMLDATTGELQERRIQHDDDDVERFYAALQPPVTVAIESTGYALWFLALMRRLGHTLFVGDAAKIRATVVRKTKTDRRDARHILTLLSEDSATRCEDPLHRLLVHADAELGRDPLDEGLRRQGRLAAAGLDDEVADRGRDFQRLPLDELPRHEVVQIAEGVRDRLVRPVLEAQEAARQRTRAEEEARRRAKIEEEAAHRREEEAARERAHAKRRLLERGISVADRELRADPDLDPGEREDIREWVQGVLEEELSGEESNEDVDDLVEDLLTEEVAEDDDEDEDEEEADDFDEGDEDTDDD